MLDSKIQDLDRGDSAMANCSEEKGDRAGIPVTPGPDRSHVERTNVIKSFSGNDVIYPDIVGDNLDIVFIGFPIATTSTFITALYHSNILTKPIDFDNQKQVLESGVGFINIPKGSRDESYTKQVMSITVEKLKVFKPKLICFNGSMLWKLFVAELIPEIKIEDVYYGLQHIGIQKTSGIFKSQFYILPSTLTSVEKNINYFDEIKHIRDKARIEQQNMRIEMINERERKSKKRPIHLSDAEFSKAKIPNLETTRHEEIVVPPHRLSGGGIADNLLKDPSDIERMDRVKRWVNEQDFDRASPEPNAMDLAMGTITSQNDFYRAFSVPLIQPQPWPTLGLERLLDSNYFQNLSSQIIQPHAGLSGIPGILPGQLTNAWPYGTSMSSLYRLPTLAQCHDWNKNLPGASNNADLATRSLLQQSDGAARVIPFVPLIQASSSAFLLPGTQTQPVIYPPGYGSSSAPPPNGPSKDKTPRDRS